MGIDGNAGGEPGVTEEELTPKEVGGFRILRRLASGSTSDVLLARAEGPHGFQRVVALKILLVGAKGRAGADAEFERTFAATASAYARLSHPAVVKLYDFFSADGQLVLVLEFVDGLPLHKLRAMLANYGERLDDKAALFLGLRIFSAVAAAHGARDPARGEFAPIVHFDINPSNVLIPWDGHVKLGDFGIAKAAGIETDARAGFIKGTYGYASPEQALGKEATLRADIYSAGLILWELLAHRKAVQRGSLNDAQVAKAMAHPEYPALDVLRPDLSGPLRTAVKRALEADPEKRSITAEEMVGILRQAVNAEEGRKVLAEAVTRLRATGPGDPLATTAQFQADSMRDGQPRAPSPSSPGWSERVDPDQTAPVSAISSESAELGKIAFYGRIKLPGTTDAPPGGPLTPGGSNRPPPLPPTLPMLPDVGPSTAPSGPEGASLSAAGVASVTPFAAAARAIPRPAPDKKPSNAPSGPPPLPDAETPMGAEVAPVMPRPGTMPMFVQSGPHQPSPAAAQPSPMMVVAPAPSPATERSPEVAADPAGDAAREAAVRSNVTTTASVRPNAPPYTLSSLPPPPKASPVVWIIGGLLGVILVAGAAVYALSGDTPPAVATTAPSAQPSAAMPAAVTPSAAVPATAASAPPVVSAEPAVASAAPAPSAAPSALPSAVASAPPPPVAVASAAPPPATAAPAAPSATPPPTTAAATPEPADSGEVDLPASAAGHRIFVDGKVGGEGAAPLHIHCGSHVIRVGSAGAEKTIKVPCGGQITF